MSSLKSFSLGRRSRPHAKRKKSLLSCCDIFSKTFQKNLMWGSVSLTPPLYRVCFYTKIGTFFGWYLTNESNQRRTKKKELMIQRTFRRSKSISGLPQARSWRLATERIFRRLEGTIAKRPLFIASIWTADSFKRHWSLSLAYCSLFSNVTGTWWPLGIRGTRDPSLNRQVNVSNIESSNVCLSISFIFSIVSYSK